MGDFWHFWERLSFHRRIMHQFVFNVLNTIFKVSGSSFLWFAHKGATFFLKQILPIKEFFSKKFLLANSVFLMSNLHVLFCFPAPLHKFLQRILPNTVSNLPD